jgi:hypothetical protein
MRVDMPQSTATGLVRAGGHARSRGRQLVPEDLVLLAGHDWFEPDALDPATVLCDDFG